MNRKDAANSNAGSVRTDKCNKTVMADMHQKEKKLDQYIDSLNRERKPREHGQGSSSPELEELFDTVRLVRTMKEPAMPNAAFLEKLAHTTESRTTRKPAAKRRRRSWFIGTAAAVAAVLVMAMLLNFVLPFGNTNIAHAMEKAFQEVQAYHGIIEVAVENAAGEDSVQSKLEIWADKEGRYYVKELEGSQKGLTTVNNGENKWQIRPDEKQVYLFSAFPDPYRFTFELGREVENVKNALKIKTTGEETIAGRRCTVLEVTPEGGEAYRIWVDKETRLPLQRQSAMQNALQYRVTYTEIDFTDAIPAELVAYELPEGFGEADINPEQLVNSLEEVAVIVGFTPKVIGNLPTGYVMDRIAIDMKTKVAKIYYATQDKKHSVVALQGKASEEFKPAATAILGKAGDIIVEIQSPVQVGSGLFSGGNPYAGVADITSIRWQQAGYEYAVLGNIPVEELRTFAEDLAGKEIVMPSTEDEPSEKPEFEVPVDMEVEENEQKSVDAGHSPWRLNPVYVAQVFVSLQMSPEGITGDYPIDYEALEIIKNTGTEAIIEVKDDDSPISRVYLKKLVRQDPTGIWTVVGYDK